MVVTDNHKVYFCRSDLNPADYVIWVRAADKESSYMFLTHADLKLARALYLRNNAFPQVLDVPSAQIQAIYKDALVALGKDVDTRRTETPASGQHSLPRPTALRIIHR